MDERIRLAVKDRCLERLGAGALGRNSIVGFPLWVDVMEFFLKRPELLQAIADALNNRR